MSQDSPGGAGLSCRPTGQSARIRPIRVSAAQLNAGTDKALNLEAAERLVRQAAGDGSRLVALPEKWNLLGPGEAMREGAEPLDGPSLSSARGWAAELGIFVLAGSIAERHSDDRLSNTSVLIDPAGNDVAVYRKIHLFDVEVDGVSYRESDAESAGDEIVLGRAGELCVGLTVCYDLRFPELHRILALRGAEAITLPSAFTEPTGHAHWEVLVRARAIENQLFVLAPNQAGEAPPYHRSYGHSLIVDPWGEVLAAAGPETDAVISADLDLERLRKVREEFPALANRRPDAYAWPQEAPV